MSRSITTFRSIRDTAPEYLPMSPAEQDQFGNSMGIPMDKRTLLGRRAVLCLPNTPMCMAWSTWAERNRALPPGAGYMLMNSNVYSQRFMDASNTHPHTSEDQELSVQATGKPLVNWHFIVSVLED